MYEMELEFFCKDKKFPFFIQYGYHSGNFFPHVHKDFTELVLVLDGTAEHVVGTESYLLSKGDVFVVGKNTVHNLKNAQEFVPCNIMFHKDFFFDSLFQLKESAGFHALFYLEPFLTKEYEFKSRLKLTYSEYKIIFPLLDKMMNEYQKKTVGWKEMIQSYFLELVVSLSRKYQIPTEPEQSKVLLIANASSYMEKNFKKELNIDELSKMACLSNRHFSRIFKETYKITPMQYVLKLRILYAADLLKNTTDTITDIALESGFLDQNYFSRCFKNYYQLSPSEYRKNIQILF